MRLIPRLPVAIAITIAWHVVMTFVAIAIDAPSQFGIVGTDPVDEWVTSGTAISAPLLPLALLAVGFLLATRRGVLRVLARVLVVATAVLFTIGGIGELAGTPTDQTSRAELVFGGVVAILFATWLVACVVADVRRVRAGNAS